MPRSGPVCALGKSRRELRLWVGDQLPAVEIEVRADGRRLKSASVPEQGGQQLTVKVPPGASVIEVRSATPQGEGAWSLKLTTPRWPLLVDKAYWLSKQEPVKAAHLLEAGITGLPPEERWLALRLRAQITRDQGAYEEAAVLFQEAIAAEHAAGSLLAEADDSTVLALLEIQRSRFAEARRLLSGLQLPAGAPAEAAYDRSYYRGLLAQHVGDARSALADLTDAVNQAKRVGILKLERWAAEQVLARQIQMLGRSPKAAALFASMHSAPPTGLPACDWGVFLSNQAWALLLAREAGESSGDPVPLLEEGRQVFEREKCVPLERKRLNYLLNLTLAHLQAGRLTAARDSLSEARALDRFTQPYLKLWSLELEARLDLDSRPEKALQLYGRLDELAARALSPDSRWRAAYGRARCYRALGRVADALAAFAKAEALLDEQSLQIPIDQGRETFAAQREMATASYLDLLLAGGRNAEALQVARRARSRVLRQLVRGDRLEYLAAADHERWDNALVEYWKRRAALDANADDDWQLPADQLSRLREARAAQLQEAQSALDRAFRILGGPDQHEDLPPPRRGEVVLAYHPLPHGWVGFASDGRTVAVHRFPLPNGFPANSTQPEQATLLLAPFRSVIERSQRVRVLPYGVLRAVDFHALPFGADVLLAARPVVYGLDLAAPAESRLPPGRRALVVANPLGDLPEAAVEAREVEAALKGRQPVWSAQTLQDTAASAGGVRGALAGADLLHYAGHGIFSGLGGWESVLPLAGGSRLTLGDLLALQRVPRWVVLSACEAGRSGADAPVEGLSLAHAFLLAGSHSVIAATGPVGDSAAEGLFAELYQRWGSTPDLAVLLQHAQLAWRHRNPAAGWASFRLFEP